MYVVTQDPLRMPTTLGDHTLVVPSADTVLRLAPEWTHTTQLDFVRCDVPHSIDEGICYIVPRSALSAVSTYCTFTRQLELSFEAKPASALHRCVDDDARDILQRMLGYPRFEESVKKTDTTPVGPGVDLRVRMVRRRK